MVLGRGFVGPWYFESCRVPVRAVLGGSFQAFPFYPWAFRELLEVALLFAGSRLGSPVLSQVSPASRHLQTINAAEDDLGFCTPEQVRKVFDTTLQGL